MEKEKLAKLAAQASLNSYSPYSNFPVGAALVTKDGKVFLGCNVENASFGLTNCAERTAIFKAVSEGNRKFTKIAISADSVLPAYPCGVCRQVMSEFAPNLQILVAGCGGDIIETSLSELLPNQFTL